MSRDFSNPRNLVIFLEWFYDLYSMLKLFDKSVLSISCPGGLFCMTRKKFSVK